MIIRPATRQDLPELLKLSQSIPGGMTSMPFDKSTWQKKLEAVEESFCTPTVKDKEAIYFFVLEDMESGEIVGTSGMHSGVGMNRPFYNYRLSRHVSKSSELDITVKSTSLILCNDFTGDTELVSLFLKKGHRQGKNGQFLSRVRFLFMHEFTDIFSDRVFAEIRGWLDAEGSSPFWDSLGKKFFNMPYFKADFISAVNGSQFISDLMPRLPVYLELLTPEAVAVIGKPNKEAAAAKKLLEKEGFYYHDTVDIFDAGPVVECDKNRIESINSINKFAVVSGLHEANMSDASECIISNCRFKEFRAAIGKVHIQEDSTVQIEDSVFDAIRIQPGDQVSILPLR
ncbi:arginine N-succinyltransferase [Sessilibacter corallicola]|uniref:Arginine N-succinyltransferase n=1 Tax=Sessilibacter corallicola TaxID=2904075 RepID=A0ABQ0AEA2_9GAMM